MAKQQRFCQAAAERLGVDLVDGFEDNATGASVIDRPGLIGLLYQLEDDRDYECVVVADWQRLSANDGDRATLLARFAQAGVRVIAASDYADPSERAAAPVAGRQHRVKAR